MRTVERSASVTVDLRSGDVLTDLAAEALMTAAGMASAEDIHGYFGTMRMAHGRRCNPVDQKVGRAFVRLLREGAVNNTTGVIEILRSRVGRHLADGLGKTDSAHDFPPVEAQVRGAAKWYQEMD
jgi:hypothetical protein